VICGGIYKFKISLDSKSDICYSWSVEYERDSKIRDFYRRGVNIMSRKKNKKYSARDNGILRINNETVNTASNKLKVESASLRREGVFKEVLVAVINSLIVSLFGVGSMVVVNAKIVLPNEISRLETKIDGLNSLLTERIDGLDGRIDTISERIGDLDGRIDTINGRLSNLENLVSAETGNPAKQRYIVYDLTSEGLSVMPMVNLIENHSTNAGLSCSDDALVLVTDRKTGKNKTTKSLIGKGILLPYKGTDGEEVYFLGQFNTKYHLDGKCITNVYKNNKLILITEAVYADGNLISYKQVLESHSQKSGDVWIIANRKHHDGVNKGTSSSYYKRKDVEKQFTMQNVEASAILGVSKFKSNLKSKQEGFYCGNTSDGVYNDNTGKAYLIKYNNDGKVRLFYCGRFKDGMQEDHSGYAWDIVLGEDGRYIYREAEYSKNHIDYSTLRDEDLNMTEKKINRKLEEKLEGIIKCKLPWDF
jgi:hypothetical protein